MLKWFLGAAAVALLLSTAQAESFADQTANVHKAQALCAYFDEVGATSGYFKRCLVHGKRVIVIMTPLGIDPYPIAIQWCEMYRDHETALAIRDGRLPAHSTGLLYNRNSPWTIHFFLENDFNPRPRSYPIGMGFHETTNLSGVVESTLDGMELVIVNFCTMNPVPQ